MYPAKIIAVAIITYLGDMTEQPRQPAGTQPTLKGRRPGGQYIPKKQPATKPENIYFNDDVHGIGAPLDWDKRDVRVRGSRTVFERIAETDEAGNESVTITATCDGPELLFLARKGDAAYWNGDTWSKDHETRRTWCADITLTMLREGAISTGYGAGVEGAQTAMTAAASQRRPRRGWGPHVLTGTVAQIRGLRVLQSMAPPKGWTTKLGGFNIRTAPMICSPHGSTMLLTRITRCLGRRGTRRTRLTRRGGLNPSPGRQPTGGTKTCSSVNKATCCGGR